ncbi:hypothetical protein AGMMS49525_04870 [Bacteroidia bacterium]|nr:hypothetical protein AGMMS49525_04870 [Bacteroidia bacterium]
MLRIKEVIKERGWKVKDIAKELGITSPALSQNIVGRVGVDRLKEIADVIGVHVTELFKLPETNGIICPHCGGKIKLEKDV